MVREYRRDLQHCYLVMYSQLHNENTGYAKYMIVENEISGLLPCSYKRIDDHILYYYDITSHISLRERLNQKKIEGEEMLFLLNSLLDVLSNIDEYLLSADAICLELDCIFIDAKMENINFCYFPDESEDIGKKIQKLFEELLPFLNHQRTDSIHLGYDIFHYLIKNSFSLDGLKEELNRLSRREIENKKYQTADEHIEQEKNVEREIDTIFEEEDSENQKKFYGIEIGIALLCIIYLFSGWYIWKNLKGYIICWGVVGIIIGSVACFIWLICKKVFDKKVVIEEDSKIEYTENNCEEETELLSELVGVNMETEVLSKKIWNHIYLLEEKYTDTPKQYELGKNEVQIIGRFHETADIILENSSISRMHARIRREENRFYLSDLNSRNGTWVNGKELIGMQEIEIRIDDEIRFAEEIYSLKKI